MSSVLEVQNLTTHYSTLRGWVRAAENVSFRVEKGQALGVAGESGGGKTTVALAILRILPHDGRIRKGKIIFDGTDIVLLSEDSMRNIRWKGIANLFHVPKN